MKTLHLQFTCLFFLITFFVACDPEPKKKIDLLQRPIATPEFAVICNEGNFQNGNASVTFYDFANDVLTDDVFKKVNNRNLGDVLQSSSLFEDEVFLVVNNSQKIEVVGRKDMLLRRTISGFKSPRNMLILSSDLAYVSEYYDNSVKVINPQTGQINATITCPGWHDQMIIVGSKLYVSTVNRNQLYIINILTNAVEDSIMVANGGADMVLDVQNRIWLLCSESAGTSSAKLFQINTTTDSVLKTFTLPDVNALRLTINGNRDRLYWISNHIYSMGINEFSLPSSPFIVSNNNNFYALGYIPHRNEIWAADAIDYIQKSTVFRYNSEGMNIGLFKSGTNTGNFLFYIE
jgi:hypothetical protein